MNEEKKEAILLSLKGSIEEIRVQVKEMKSNMKRIAISSMMMSSLFLILTLSLVGFTVSLKKNIENRFQLIIMEYNKIKSLENKFKKIVLHP